MNAVTHNVLVYKYYYEPIIVMRWHTGSKQSLPISATVSLYALTEWLK